MSLNLVGSGGIGPITPGGTLPPPSIELTGSGLKDWMRMALRPRVSSTRAREIIETLPGATSPPAAAPGPCPPCPPAGVQYVYRPDCPPLVLPSPTVSASAGQWPMPAGMGPSVAFGPGGEPVVVGDEVPGELEAGVMSSPWAKLGAAALAGAAVWYYQYRYKKKRKRKRKLATG